MTRKLQLGLLLLFLILCCGCGKQAVPVLVQIPPPKDRLVPTPIPKMQGNTNLDLWEHNDDLEFALKQCNKDKSDLLRWVQQTTKE